MKSSPVRNLLLLVATAILFSTGGAAIKSAQLTPWQIAGFRSGLAAAVLLAAVPAARKGWSWRLAPVAAAYAATVILFVLATRLTTAANAIFLQSAAPLYLLLLGPWLLREPVRRSDIGFIIAVAAGMSLFAFGAERAMRTAPDPATGNACAVASGVAWAFVLAGLRWLSRDGQDRGITAVAAGNALAFAVALPLALAGPRPDAASIAVIGYLGIFQIGLAYWCLTRAIRHVSAFEATTVLLLEPALNPVWVWLVHGERPGGWPLAGGSVILIATLVNAWKQASRR